MLIKKTLRSVLTTPPRLPNMLNVLIVCSIGNKRSTVRTILSSPKSSRLQPALFTSMPFVVFESFPAPRLTAKTSSTQKKPAKWCLMGWTQFNLIQSDSIWFNLNDTKCASRHLRLGGENEFNSCFANFLVKVLLQSCLWHLKRFPVWNPKKKSWDLKVREYSREVNDFSESSPERLMNDSGLLHLLRLVGLVGLLQLLQFSPHAVGLHTTRTDSDGPGRR